MKFRSFMPFPKCIITLVLVLIMSQIVNPVFSKVISGDIDKVEITLFIVPEIVACAPKGYTSYNADCGTNYPPITLDDIQKWKQLGRNYKTFTISNGAKLPHELNLGEKLFEILDVYTTRPKDIAKERLAAVLVFKWDKPKSLKVSLNRVVSKKINILSCTWPVGPENQYTWAGELKNQQYWIHHERADAFFPANDIKWILKAGNQVWEFVSKK